MKSSNVDGGGDVVKRKWQRRCNAIRKVVVEMLDDINSDIINLSETQYHE